MHKDAFICHASEDKHLARSVWIRLQQYGVTAWLDEAEMSGGDVLVQKIASAIHTSQWFIVLLTPTSVAKKWVTFELNHAMDLEVREGRTFVIPVIADDCEIPEHLQSKLYIDIRNRGDYDKGIGFLIKTLKSDASVIPADFVQADLSNASEEELMSLPRAQFALERCLRSQKYIARTLRTLGAMANLLPKQVITYCESMPHITVCPTIDATGDIFYGIAKRIKRRYRSNRRYQEELSVYLQSLRVHSSATYLPDVVSHFLSFHE